MWVLKSNAKSVEEDIVAEFIANLANHEKR